MLDDARGLAQMGGVVEETADGGLTWAATGETSLGPELDGNEGWRTYYDAAVQGYPPHGDSALEHTTDGGLTWQRVDVPGYGIFLGAWFVGADGWVLATQCYPGDPTDPQSTDPPPCIDRETLLHSADNGESWAPLPEPGFTMGDQVERVDTLTAYRVGGCAARCRGGQLYKTSDGGQTWVEVLDSGSSGSIHHVRFTSQLEGWLTGTRLAPPTNPPSAPEFVGRLARTRDGGTTWTFIELPPGTGGDFDVTSTHVVMASSSGIALYELAKGSWQKAATDVRPPLETIVFASASRGFAVAVRGDGGADREPWTTFDGGETWDPWVTPNHLKVIAVTSDAVWASGDRPLYRSTDGGTSWQEVLPPPNADLSKGLRIIASAGDRIWLASDVWLWRSDNLGASWAGIDVAPRPEYAFIDRDHGWTAQCGPWPCEQSFRMTADGGDTWETRALPDGVSVGGFVTSLDGWGRIAEGGTSRFTYTHDGGVTWQAQETALTFLAGPTFIDIKTAFAVTYDPGLPRILQVVSTLDGGQSWRTEFSVNAGLNLPKLTTADGRVWVVFSELDAGLDLAGSVERVTICRRDIVGTPDRLE